MELGSTVTLVYKGTLDDGTMFGYADADNPMVFQTGMDLVIDGLEKAVLEMNEIGEKKTVVLNEYEGYGEYLDDYTAKVPKWQIPVDNVKVGQRIWMSNSEDGSSIPATVLEIGPDDVLFDLNHPLAGKTLTFEIEILDIEEPPENFMSAEERARKFGDPGAVLGGEQGNDYR